VKERSAVNLYVGIDIGTTATKVGVFDEEGRRVALAKSSCPVSRPQPGFVEQNPDDWWRSVLDSWREVCRQGVSPNDVRAVAVSGHFTTVFLDETGRPARPAITWQDARAVEEAEELSRRYDERRIRELFGVYVPFSPAMPAAKIRWVTSREPFVREHLRWIVQAKDYIVLQLCGEVCSDVQSLLGIVHAVTGEADKEYLNDLGLDPSQLPRIVRPYRNAGYMTVEGYRATGIRIGVPVIVGWIDAFCSMLATGIYRPNAAFDYAGTSEIVGIRAAALPERHDGLLALPFDRKSAVVYGLTNCGADALAWATSALGAASLDELVEIASRARPSVDNPIFLPYLEGERSPVWDAQATGVWVNLRRSHGREELAYSVLEGVVYAVAQILEAASKAANAQPAELIVSGGGAKSDLWNQIRADVTGLPVQVVEETETGALGAAMLAAVGHGEFEAMSDAAEAMTRLGKRWEPRPDVHTLHRRRRAVYDAIYEATRGLRL